VTGLTPHTPDGASLVTGWLIRLAAVGWRLLAAIALGLVLFEIAAILSTVTASILIAAIIAATFAPFVLGLRGRGWSRVKAAAVVFLGAAVVILATLAVIAIAFLPYVPQVLDQIEASLTALQQGLAAWDVPPEVGAATAGATTGLEGWLSGSVAQVVGSLATVVTVSILATFLTFFFLMDGDKAWVWILSSASDWRREAVTTSGDDALARVGGYLRGTAVIAAFDGITEGLFLAVLGVPNAAALGVIVFLGRFIPYIGGLVTTILLLLVTLETAGQTAALILLVLIAIVNVIQGKVLAPMIYHKTVNIHPALVLVALPAGAALAGVVGLFVAIPVVAFGLAIAGALVSVLGVDPTGPRPGDPMVPIWLDRLGQWSWRLLVAIGLLAVAIGAAVQVPLVVIPLVLGLILAATLAPLGLRLERRGWRQSRAALGATLGAAAGVTLVVGLTLVSLVDPVRNVIGRATAGAEAVDANGGGNAGALVATVQSFGAGTLAVIADVLSSLSGLAVVLLLSTLLTYYFMRDGAAFWQTFLRRVEAGRRSQVDAAGRRAFEVLGGYMIGTGAISIFGAVTQFIIMTILGIPFALPLAVLAVFGGFIPYVGSLITTGLAFLVTVATGTPTDVAIMAVYTIVFNIVQGNVVAPLVYSRVVRLHPAVVLMAIPAGAEVAGVIGMFLVVPFLGVVAATWRTVLRVLDTEPFALPESTRPEDAS